MSQRKLAVAGTFYPERKEEVQRYFEHFNKVLDENNITVDRNLKPRSIIVPHAGYIYSGFTANIAYKYIPKDIDNIIVIGPSHKFAFSGASIALYDSYPTPFGALDINLQLSNSLMNKFDFLSFNEQVHCEHSTEVQFPFIKYYHKNAKVVEIVYSDCDFNNIAQVIDVLLQDPKNFVVISTDLSHFYSLNNAKLRDNVCLDAIQTRNLDVMNQGCEACGAIGVKAMIQVANSLDLKPTILDYRTSADTSADESSVVGYTSIVFT